MSATERLVVVSVVRKVVLAAAICVAAVEAHVRWGFEWTGPGMHQVSLLFTVAMVAAFCSVLFLSCSGVTAWFIQRKKWPAHWAADVALFAGCCGFAVWVAVTTKIVE